ncbi:MAG: hypothetical protein ACJ8LM_00630, partial [Candidatus Udaeobacter sp.]
IVLFIGSEGRFLWQITAAVVSVVVYAAVLLALKTFSVEEIHHAREGIAFVSPFIESWMKKLKRNT